MNLLARGLCGTSILMGPYDRRPWLGSAFTASLLLTDLQICQSNEEGTEVSVTCWSWMDAFIVRRGSKWSRWTHWSTGHGVVGLTQLHRAVEIQTVWLGGEAKHAEAVAHGGGLPVPSGLPVAPVDEGDGWVVHTAEGGGGGDRMWLVEFNGEWQEVSVSSEDQTRSEAVCGPVLQWSWAVGSVWPSTRSPAAGRNLPAPSRPPPQTPAQHLLLGSLFFRNVHGIK